MTERISNELLAQLSVFVAARMGLHFPQERWRDLARGIHSTAREFDFETDESCARWLLSAPIDKSQLETLARHLTIGETYFFREGKALEALTENILPCLIRARQEGEQRLRIWSAGCSTGEEAYSIAMLLDRLFAQIKSWQVTVIATDINPRVLQKASAGVYSEWSFRGTPAWVKENYFERRKGDRYEILPRIKQMVKFSYLNLAEDTYPSLLNNTNVLDVIFCRNVLMYFTREQAQKVVNNFSLSLVEGGWLIVSPSELSSELFSEFTPVNFPGAILYQKECAASRVRLAARDIENDAPALPAQAFVVESVAETERDVAHSPAATYDEALAFYQQGRYRETEEILHKLISIGQDDIAAHALLARTLANQGQHIEALQSCERAIAIDKTNPVIHYLRATILQEQDQIEEAARALRRSLFLNHTFVLAHFALGNLTRQQGRLRESKKHFENALALLGAYKPEDTLPESDGITAGRLAEILRQAMTGVTNEAAA